MFNDNLLDDFIKSINDFDKMSSFFSTHFIASKLLDNTVYKVSETIDFYKSLYPITDITLKKEESYYLMYFKSNDIKYISKIKLNNTDSLIESIVLIKDLNETNTVLVIEYDGSKYYGMQRQQALNQPTIQKEIEDAIKKMIHKDVSIISSSRTDRGVHAKGQVVAFNSFNIEPNKYMYALNNILPDSIRIKDAYNRSILFNPRFDTLKKTYEYLIKETKLSAFESSYYAYKKINDIERLKKELNSILGTHDFYSFSKEEKENTVRTILDVNVEAKNNIIKLTITGTGFLHNMIRFIVGALFDIDDGRDTTLLELISKMDKNLTKTLASPNGLYLTKIYY